MKIHHVRYFLALSEEQNFTRAARRCRVSQPSLSNAIKALEKEMGGELFSRAPTAMITNLGLASPWTALSSAVPFGFAPTQEAGALSLQRLQALCLEARVLRRRLACSYCADKVR